MPNVTKQDTGVFVGIGGATGTGPNSFASADTGKTTFSAYSTLSELLCAAAGRLSYSMNLQGPCVALDTGCSASLVATHLGSAAL